MKRLLRRKEKEKQRFDEFDWIDVRSRYWMKTPTESGTVLIKNRRIVRNVLCSMVDV
jgi:hypothetical protein